jgi:glycerate dehydrogenase
LRAVFLDSEGLDDLSLAPLEEQCSSLEVFATTQPGEVQLRLAGAEVVIVNKVRLNGEALRASPSLRLIAVVATGTDIIDFAAAAAQGIAVCNCQAYGTDSVAQHVFAAILALHTNLLAYRQAVAAGRWQRARQFCFLDYPISEVRGKLLGIVGYGELGRAVARIAGAFGIRVVLIRRPGGPADDRPALMEILPQLDILSLHCPLTPATRNLIDHQALALMKPSAFLINAARGGLVDEKALAAALSNRRLAGAAVDVLSAEPPRDGNPLLDPRLENLILTPHVAWASREARQRIIAQTAENIAAFKAGQSLRLVPVLR